MREELSLPLWVMSRLIFRIKVCFCMCVFFSGKIYFQHRFHTFLCSFRVSVFTCLGIPSLPQLYYQLDGSPERSDTLACTGGQLPGIRSAFSLQSLMVCTKGSPSNPSSFGSSFVPLWMQTRPSTHFGGPRRLLNPCYQRRPIIS